MSFDSWLVSKNFCPWVFLLGFFYNLTLFTIKIKLLLIILLSTWLWISLGDVSFAGWKMFWIDKIDPDLKSWGTDIVEESQNIVVYIVGLLYFIALVFGLWGWFLILTSGWDDDRVKKGKKVIIYMAVGLIVIFLASTLVRWLTEVFTKNIS